MEQSSEPFPYFYQLFQGDEYLREADLICARGFAADAYRRAADLSFSLSFSSFFFLLPSSSLVIFARATRVNGKPRRRDRRWRNNEEHPGGWRTVAVHVSLNILCPLSTLDRGNSTGNFTPRTGSRSRKLIPYFKYGRPITRAEKLSAERL